MMLFGYYSEASAEAAEMKQSRISVLKTPGAANVNLETQVIFCRETRFWCQAPG
jgi:hypothetical protein